MFECIICMEFFKNTDEVCATTCGHVHHFKCLEDWRSRSPHCPQCRTPNPDSHKIFLNFDRAENETLKTQLEQKDAEIAKLQEQVASNESIVQHSLDDSQRICAELQEKLEYYRARFESIELDNIQKVAEKIELEEKLSKMEEESKRKAILSETELKCSQSTDDVDDIIDIAQLFKLAF